MKLTAFLKQKGLTGEQFAARIGVQQATISRLSRGLIRPSIEMIARIRLATDGLVTGEEWIAREVAAISDRTWPETWPETGPETWPETWPETCPDGGQR